MKSTSLRVCSAALLLLLASATAGRAGTPSPATSTMDAVIVGSPRGIAIGGYPPGFDVRVRDATFLPVAGSVVSLGFAGTGLRLYLNQASGTTLDCANQTLSRITDNSGQVNFVARFGGYVNSNQIVVRASDVVLGSVRGRSLDYHSDGRVSLADYVLFSDDFLNNPSSERSDFDLNGNTGLGDFYFFSEQYEGRYDPPPPPEPLCP